jgi:dTDP-4-amino-4,6-dideoxygalactose transaminase
VTAVRIPLSAPDVSEADVQAVCDVLRSAHLSLGPKVPEFEGAVAAYVDSPHAVAVSSGTAGLHLCVRALGIGEGDEMIVPSFAFIAAANAVRYERATPVFVDIDPLTLNIDPERVEAAVTPRTRALLVVHTFGRPAEMGALLEIARRHGLAVVEDACEAIGAEYGGRKVGAMGDLGVFAFYPNKQMTTGEGGVVMARDAAVSARIRALRNHGRGATTDWFEHAEVGFNYRLSDIACALGLSQLGRLEAILGRRAAVARLYDERLRGRSDLVLPPAELPQRRMSWFVYVVRLAARFDREARDAVRSHLLDRGIGCGRYFAPIHLQPAYREGGRLGGSLSVTEAEAARCLALPFFNAISEAQVDEICGALTEALDDLHA